MSKIKTLALALATVTLVSSAAMAAETPKSAAKAAHKQAAAECAKSGKKGTPEYKNCMKDAKAKSAETAPKAQ